MGLAFVVDATENEKEMNNGTHCTIIVFSAGSNKHFLTGHDVVCLLGAFLLSVL